MHRLRNLNEKISLTSNTPSPGMFSEARPLSPPPDMPPQTIIPSRIHHVQSDNSGHSSPSMSDGGYQWDENNCFCLLFTTKGLLLIIFYHAFFPSFFSQFLFVLFVCSSAFGRIDYQFQFHGVRLSRASEDAGSYSAVRSGYYFPANPREHQFSNLTLRRSCPTAACWCYRTAISSIDITRNKFLANLENSMILSSQNLARLQPRFPPDRIARCEAQSEIGKDNTPLLLLRYPYLLFLISWSACVAYLRGRHEQCVLPLMGGTQNDSWFLTNNGMHAL